MFTGIIREIGWVAAVSQGTDALRIEVDAPETASSTAVGDSVAVNGCCLTAVSSAGARLSFDAVAETLARTSIGALVPGDAVNVEPALRAGEPLGGHYVQGHVDGVGTVTTIPEAGNGWRMGVGAPAGLLRYLVSKGSITVDGVSLTVAGLDGHGFEVALVPHTLASTTLGGVIRGAVVNLEVDVLAKYIERLLPPR